MDEIDFDALIINERHKIWEDKMKLTNQIKSNDDLLHYEDRLKNDGKFKEFKNNDASNVENTSPNQNQNQTHSKLHHIGALSENSPFNYVQCETNSLANVAGKPSDPRCRSAAFTKANTEPRMATMVRFGEYSPLNPNLLSPGKSLLGLGEYEEKRRLLMNRKKQEYREYLSQVRRFDSKNSTPTKPKEITKQTNLFSNAETNNIMSDNINNENKPLSTVANASTNTTPRKPVEYVKLSNILHDSKTSPCTKIYLPTSLSNVPMVVTNASTNTIPESVSRDMQTELDWDLGTLSVRLPEKNHTETSPKENVWTDLPTSKNLKTRGVAGNEATPEVSSQTVEKPWAQNSNQHAAVNEPVKFLSPRERKLADLKDSGALSPSFDCADAFAQDGISQTAIKMQREAYKEELRKQIEEKQRLDAQLREKARLEEEMMARKIFQQQEQMRQEFLREEAEKKKQQLQISSKMEEFRRRQEETKKAERERYLRTKSSANVATQERGRGCDDDEARGEEQLPDESLPAVPAPARALQKLNRRQTNAASCKPRGTPSEEGPADSVRNRNEKVDLDDSLPIPVFRIRIPPLITTVEKSQNQASANSKEMQILEAKWQIPAVQKTSLAPTAEFLGDGSQGSLTMILTQQGAFRKQLQIEQMRLEELVQQRNRPNFIE